MDIDLYHFSGFRRTFGTCLVLTLCLVLMGCASSRTPGLGRLPGDVPGVPASQMELTLRQAMAPWTATPHRFGGAAISGADCSGFVLSLYRDVFDLDLPRTTREQARAGQAVSKRELSAGDLVFFSPGNTISHVGVYLSGGRFAHISTSRGFVVSHMDEPYWSRRFTTARRVLDGSAVAVIDRMPEPLTPEPVVAVPTISRRGGW